MRARGLLGQQYRAAAPQRQALTQWANRNRRLDNFQRGQSYPQRNTSNAQAAFERRHRAAAALKRRALQLAKARAAKARWRQNFNAWPNAQRQRGPGRQLNYRGKHQYKTAALRKQLGL